MHSSQLWRLEVPDEVAGRSQIRCLPGALLLACLQPPSRWGRGRSCPLSPPTLSGPHFMPSLKPDLLPHSKDRHTVGYNFNIEISRGHNLIQNNILSLLCFLWLKKNGNTTKKQLLVKLVQPLIGRLRLIQYDIFQGSFIAQKRPCSYDK